MRAIYGFLCRVAKPFVWMVAVLAVSVVSAAAQSTSAGSSTPQDVSQQLHELKQQYEQTTREFQKRIADLEAEINKQNDARQAEVLKGDVKEKQAEPPQTAATTPSTANPTTVSMQNLAAQVAKAMVLGETDEVGQRYQGTLPSEPTYDLLN
jgi:TolA-binding protein